MRAAHSDTFFGQLWLVLNPCCWPPFTMYSSRILAGRGGFEYFVHLVAGLFAFYFISNCITAGAASITGGGRLVMNMAFPRLLMPFSAVRTAFFRFLPTMIVYFAFHIIGGLPWSPVMLLALVFLALMIVFGLGAAAIVRDGAGIFSRRREFLALLPTYLALSLSRAVVPRGRASPIPAIYGPEPFVRPARWVDRPTGSVADTAVVGMVIRSGVGDRRFDRRIAVLHVQGA